MTTHEELQQAASERKDSIENGWRTLLDDHCWLLSVHEHNVQELQRFADLLIEKHNKLARDFRINLTALSVALERLEALESKRLTKWDIFVAINNTVMVILLLIYLADRWHLI